MGAHHLQLLSSLLCYVWSCLLEHINTLKRWVPARKADRKRTQPWKKKKFLGRGLNSGPSESSGHSAYPLHHLEASQKTTTSSSSQPARFAFCTVVREAFAAPHLTTIAKDGYQGWLGRMGEEVVFVFTFWLASALVCVQVRILVVQFMLFYATALLF